MFNILIGIGVAIVFIGILRLTYNAGRQSALREIKRMMINVIEMSKDEEEDVKKKIIRKKKK